MRSQGKSSQINEGDIVSRYDGDKLRHYVVWTIDGSFLIGIYYWVADTYILSYKNTQLIETATLIAKSELFKSEKDKKEYVAVLNALQ